jgi:hypothetical protein
MVQILPIATRKKITLDKVTLKNLHPNLTVCMKVALKAYFVTFL